MKKTWFIQFGLSESEADMLFRRYQAQGYEVKKSLGEDLITWVSVKLPEFERLPRQDRTYQQKVWRD